MQEELDQVLPLVLTSTGSRPGIKRCGLVPKTRQKRSTIMVVNLTISRWYNIRRVELW